jgi:uncharacterized protein
VNSEVEIDFQPLRSSISGLRTSIFGLIIFSLILFSSCNDIRKSYYENGDLKDELSNKNGVLDGPSVWYFHTGKLMMKATYQKGKIEGRMTRWYFNGNPEIEGDYVNNRRNGKSIQYFEEGGKQLEQNYTNDTLNGPFTEYYPGDKIKTKGSYNMGLWDGKWEYYDEKGLLVGEGDFIKGSGILKGYSWNGRLIREVHYKNNQKDGKEILYKENGLLDKVREFKQDKLIEEKM